MGYKLKAQGGTFEKEKNFKWKTKPGQNNE